MNLPKRIKRKSGRDGRLRSPSHLRWIRGFACSVPLCPEHRIEAAHVRTGTDGGTGMKPSDKWAISLCWWHHKQQHDVGEAAFERFYDIDMKKIAEALWQLSPHRKKVA